MKSGTLNTIIAAVVGGVVGAVVAFACGAFSTTGLPETIDKLKVGELIVSEKMMLWQDGDEDASLLIQNGGVLAKTRLIATQICGNTVTANAVLTTPDNPLNPLNECEIFTELASSKAEGGMLTVRSPNGGNILGNPDGIQNGLAYTITYDNQGAPVCLFRKNDNGQRILGQFIGLPPGQENGTIAIMFPQVPPQGGQPPEMPQNASANPPAQGMTMPPDNTALPVNPNPGGQQGVEQAMNSSVAR